MKNWKNESKQPGIHLAILVIPKWVKKVYKDSSVVENAWKALLVVVAIDLFQVAMA